jgi:hypothetical protein
MGSPPQLPYWQVPPQIAAKKLYPPKDLFGKSLLANEWLLANAVLAPRHSRKYNYCLQPIFCTFPQNNDAKGAK